MLGKTDYELEKMRQDCQEYLPFGEVSAFAKKKGVTRNRISHIILGRTRGKKSITWLMELHPIAMKHKKKIELSNA